MWRVSDLWVEWLIFVLLFFMLAYTVLVTARFFRRYVSAHRKSSAAELGSAPPSQRCDKNLVVRTSWRAVENLKSIASAAPFLGLAGTCYGILAMFFRGYAACSEKSQFTSEYFAGDINNDGRNRRGIARGHPSSDFIQLSVRALGET